MRTVSLVFAAAITFGCHSDEGAGEPGGQAAPIDLSAWTPEVIELPPGFAPTLPAGRETILFAPGWRTAGAEDFWSYVFLMQIEEAGVDAPRLAELFDLYFDGLVSAVGNGKPFELPSDPATVTFRHERGDRYTGRVETFDAFGSGDPLTLHLVVDVGSTLPESTLLRVRASPVTPGDNAVWAALEGALASLQFE